MRHTLGPLKIRMPYRPPGFQGKYGAPLGTTQGMFEQETPISAQASIGSRFSVLGVVLNYELILNTLPNFKTRLSNNPRLGFKD